MVSLPDAPHGRAARQFVLYYIPAMEGMRAVVSGQ
jgi:hypothetical protein